MCCYGEIRGAHVLENVYTQGCIRQVCKLRVEWEVEGGLEYAMLLVVG
jgi:hypothetical protein